MDKVTCPSCNALPEYALLDNIIKIEVTPRKEVNTAFDLTCKACGMRYVYVMTHTNAYDELAKDARNDFNSQLAGMISDNTKPTSDLDVGRVRVLNEINKLKSYGDFTISSSWMSQKCNIGTENASLIMSEYAEQGLVERKYHIMCPQCNAGLLYVDDCMNYEEVDYCDICEYDEGNWLVEISYVYKSDTGKKNTCPRCNGQLVTSNGPVSFLCTQCGYKR